MSGYPARMPATPERSRLNQARRIVVKLGTAVVTHESGEPALGRVHGLIEQLASLRRAGKDLVVVSSGSVGLGRRVLGMKERPTSLGLRQACAAVGQGALIALYSQAFNQLGLSVGQVLLTQSDLADRDRALCLRTTLMRLLELGVIPILNENDSVSVRELIEHLDLDGPEHPVGFGDNDGLSARVAVAVDADLLILLTDVEGLHSANPRTDPTAHRLATLRVVDDDTLARATGSSASGTGGMHSKLEAARVAADGGIATLIASGMTADTLVRALAGEDIGTLVWPESQRRPRERHIAVGARPQGAVVVNEGAIRALTEAKASLLPIGVTQVTGQFARGDVVEIRDASGRIHGRGLVNYDAEACRAIAGRHSSEIDRILGYRGYDALITRDNLVLGEV